MFHLSLEGQSPETYAVLPGAGGDDLLRQKWQLWQLCDQGLLLLIRPGVHRSIEHLQQKQFNVLDHLQKSLHRLQAEKLLLLSVWYVCIYV